MSADTLDRWMNQLLRYVRSGSPDLTNRQMALLLLVYRTDGPHTVRGLATTLHVSKPVVSRALDTLCKLGMLRREQDLDDLRSIFVRPTPIGDVFLADRAQATGSLAARPI